MKTFIILFLLSSFAYAQKLNYKIQREVEQTSVNHNSFYVVEFEYADIFKQDIFEKEVHSILKTLEKVGDSQKFIEVSFKHDQGIFVERYFKKELYDAYLVDANKIKIYTKRLK